MPELSTAPAVVDPYSLENLTARFDANLAECQPLLFNLADQVSAAAPERGWKLIIGEDTSGRPATRFIRKVLQEQGIDLPTAYVCTSESTRRKLGPEPFASYLADVALRHDNPDSVLVVSEKITTGGSAKFINELLRQQFDRVDFAIIGSRYDPPPVLEGGDRMMLGGVAVGSGEEEIIFRTFEEIVKLDTLRAKFGLAAIHTLVKVGKPHLIPKLFQVFPIRTGISYPLHNLVASTKKPTADMVSDTTYRPLARHVYERMDELAREYVAERAGAAQSELVA